MTAAPRPGHQHEPLARTLGIASLVLYGLGTIIGAGIYVLVGEVASEAGAATPLAFVLAGVLASLTGLSYAELVGRNPAAEGSVAFVHHAFGSRLLSLVTGIAFAAVTIVASASITLGGAAYVARWIDLPQPVIGGAVVVVFTAIACLRVTESVRVAALFSAVEVVGLLVVIAVGSPSLSGIGPELAAMIPGSTDGWLGLGAGTFIAFIAFFAYIGSEGMANMVEETADVGRTLPRAILVAIAISGILYGVVSLIAVLAVEPEELAGNPAPLIPVLERYAPQMIGTFAAVAVVATLNGVLIGIVVAARLAYGMAR
ncbi:MAG: amino acid permease, partial [Alphaproteobacteria bacterium]|nr:amino acid permease [Alphaproteobacteria bacterium]